MLAHVNAVLRRFRNVFAATKDKNPDMRTPNRAESVARLAQVAWDFMEEFLLESFRMNEVPGQAPEPCD